MNKVILEGSKLVDRKALHKILKKELKFPEYYGENLDALWDCLITDIELPVVIEWINFEMSKKLLGDYAESTLKIFQEAERSTEGRVQIHIKI